MPATNSPVERIRVIPGLEAVRRRPGMFLSPRNTERGRYACLVEQAIKCIVEDEPAPTAVRLTLWRDRTITIAFDGEPLPIHAVERDGISHTALYPLFLHLSHARRSFNLAGTVLNALSEHLMVSTIVDGRRYHAGFSRGGVVSLLAADSWAAERLGTTWLTFVPDPSLIPEELRMADAAEIAEHTSTPALRVSLHDRSREEADWG